jgi:transposase
MGHEGEEQGVERPRIVEADRRQLRWQTVDLESTLAADHRARVVWAAVERLDLSQYYAVIAARGSTAGRPAIDPKILLALWLYATNEGVGSARQLSRLCERDDAYRWICGGVTPNHHTLSDFRVAHEEKLDDLLSQLLAALTSKGLLKLRRVAQDGMRVRASAGAASFRRGSKLSSHLAAAQEQVAALKQELAESAGASTAREKAAAERAAREREERLRKALAELPKVERVWERNRRRASKARRRKGSNGKGDEPRVSTTDADARVMKMGDGGYRPAYNLQFATDTEARVVVGVAVTNAGTDSGQMVPMADQIEQRTEKRPEQYLVDGGYASLAAIDEMERRRIAVYAPVPAPRREGADAHERKRDDTDLTMQWRTRMATDDAKAIYKERASTAETVNGDFRMWRGLRQLTVRGQTKVLSVTLLMVLAHNIMRAAAIGGLP